MVKKTDALLQVNGVQKTFNTPAGVIEVLKNITFELFKGESIALVGASGSGKSTLLSLLAGLDTASTGSIFFQNTNFTTAKQKTLQKVCKSISIVFQQIYLMEHLNILENITLPLEIQKNALPKGDIKQKALTLLEQVELLHRKDSFPYQVSGGEAQRAAIARALIQEPSIVLADEPTGNLDTTNGAKVSKLLFDLVKKKSASLILVTHNEALANQCDRKLSLYNGEILAK